MGPFTIPSHERSLALKNIVDGEQYRRRPPLVMIRLHVFGNGYMLGMGKHANTANRRHASRMNADAHAVGRGNAPARRVKLSAAAPLAKPGGNRFDGDLHCQ